MRGRGRKSRSHGERALPGQRSGPGHGQFTPNPPVHRPQPGPSPAPRGRPRHSPAPPLTQPGPGLQLRVLVQRRGRFLPGASDWSSALSIKVRPQGEGDDWLLRRGGVGTSLWAQGSEGPGGRSRVPPLGWGGMRRGAPRPRAAGTAAAPRLPPKRTELVLPG